MKEGKGKGKTHDRHSTNLIPRNNRFVKEVSIGFSFSFSFSFSSFFRPEGRQGRINIKHLPAGPQGPKKEKKEKDSCQELCDSNEIEESLGSS